MKRPLLLILLVLLADQVLKVWVKLTFRYTENIALAGDWAYLHFIENRGMAFGLEFGGPWGKPLLTLLRIVAVFALAFALRRMVRTGSPGLLVTSVALILAGALGNIIDSTFYGVLFGPSSYTSVATFLPPEGGYAPLFHGAVVDMLYFPIWEGTLPAWLPYWGGQEFIFFQPVFNLADAAITVGVVLFILAHRREPVAEPVGPTPSPHTAVPSDTGDPEAGAPAGSTPA